MKALPRGYLKADAASFRKIYLKDLVVMLESILKASTDPEIGFVDASRTVEEVISRLNKYVWLRQGIVESALYCANHLNEQGKFRHITGVSFNDWVLRFLRRGEKFDRTYSMIVPVGKALEDKIDGEPEGLPKAFGDSGSTLNGSTDR